MRCITKKCSGSTKYNIYVCAANEDREALLKDISKEMFEHDALTVFYREPGDESDLLPEDIHQMQLCVVLVTTDFLAGRDEVTLREFRDFVNSPIPVLPILVEENLEAWFDEVCGNLHCLKKNDSGFKKELKSYLEQVLTSDEVYEKIRGLFKKQMFVSYRKKDKEYVFKLIHRIYDDESFSDTAVWYDGFLTPGENFDEAILEAMDASDLFVLAVTPSLLEKPNYVMNEEYPYACKRGMEILPVHGMPTDPDKLKELFADIPEGVNYEDASALHELVRRLLDLKGELQGTKESLHTGAEAGMEAAYKTYYLGIAFLKGICVEYRPERGIEYITRAADAGVREAVERLVFVYKNGDGTVIDYEKAVEWQKKVVEIRKAESEAGERAHRQDSALETDEENNENYLPQENYYQSLLELIILLQHAGKTQEASGYCDKTILFLEGLEKTNSKIYATNGLIEIFKRQMDVEIALGNLERAQEVCMKCIGALEWIRENEGTEISLTVLNIVQRLGYLSFLQGSFEEAEKYYQMRLQKLLEYNTKSERKSDTRRIVAENEELESLVNAYIDLYDVYTRLGKREEAEQSIQKAMEIMPEDSSCAINCYERMGDMHRDRAEYSEAKELYLKSLELCEASYEKSRLQEMKRSTAVKYCKLGIIHARMNELDECIGWFEKYKETGRELLDNANVSDNRRGFATACMNLAEMYAYMDIERAIACLKDAETMFYESEGCNRSRPEVMVLMECGQSLIRKYMQVGKAEQAYVSLVNLANLVRDCYLKTREVWILPKVTEYYMTLAEMAKTEEEIIAHLHNSAALYGEWILADESEMVRMKYSDVLLKLGIFSEQREPIAKAREILAELRKKAPLDIDLTKRIIACDKAMKKWGKS